MASPSPSKKTASRPGPLRPARSFHRTDSQESSEPLGRPGRANTLQNGSAPETGMPPRRAFTNPRLPEEPTTPDAFEITSGDEEVEVMRTSVDMDELPIELVSLTDSFIESLTAKVHPTPPNIDNLSRLFQDFYATASTHINTHVASLLSRHNREREQSPAPSLASRTSASSIFRVKAASIGGKDKPRTPEPKPAENERQMITAEELADRKRARKAIEAKRGILEEAVERRLCESIYDKIYRHHTTQDEAQDAKLRSKTAALAVVGIGPADLGVNLGMDSATTPEAAAEKSAEIGRWLFEARRELIRMSEKRYPLGKLHHLKAVHKCIVDTLAHFHPSSSADEIMPMLIYTLITLPPDKLHVISDVNFIHRFRWEPRLTGESAYCLTNLEAAISFLETVDLSTLRADESPSGPPKPASTPAGTPRAETFPPAYSSALFPPGGPTAVDGAPAVDNVHPLPSPSGLRAAAVQLRNRRLSDLIPTPAQAIGAASDAVRTTADQGLRNIGNIGASLGESYKFLWGRLAQVQQQQQQQQTNDPKKSPTAVVLPVPQTLDDARKLVSTPPPQADDEGSLASGSSSLHNPEETLDGATGSAGHKDRPLPASPAPSTTATTTPGKDDRTLNLIAGNRKPSRDHSADSSRSAGGASLSATTRRVMRSSGPGEDARDKTASTEHAPSPAESTPVTSPSPSASALESMRSLGSSLNPMSRIAGISMIRGFGRSMASSPSTPAPPVPAKDARISVEGGDLATAFPDLADALPPKEEVTPPPQAPRAAKAVVSIAPPIERFMTLQNPGELRIGEVLELLRDYRRLAGALKELGAFATPSTAAGSSPSPSSST